MAFRYASSDAKLKNKYAEQLSKLWGIDVEDVAFRNEGMPPFDEWGINMGEDTLGPNEVYFKIVGVWLCVSTSEWGRLMKGAPDDFIIRETQERLARHETDTT